MNDAVKAAGGRVPTPSVSLPNAAIDHSRLEAMCKPDDTLAEVARKARVVAGLEDDVVEGAADTPDEAPAKAKAR